MPGTGKTATVFQVIRELRQASQAKVAYAIEC